MSQRQDKYIAQLLKANRERLFDLYHQFAGGKVAHIGGHAAVAALQRARDALLLELAEARNLAYVDWENEEEQYDYGDQSPRQIAELEGKLESGAASVECFFLYVRDRAGKWDMVDSLGMCWIENQADRDMYVREYNDVSSVCAALYRHRDRDDFGEFSRRWVPGHYATGE